MNRPVTPETADLPPYLTIEDGRLHMQGRDLIGLAEERGTPLYVYSAPRIAETARAIAAACRTHHPLARLCFASKALSAIKILRLIKEAGCLLEVNSGGELYRAYRAGFTADEIAFNGVSKSEAEIVEALSPPVFAINVDSLCELGRIARIAAALGRPARIALRMVPDVASRTSPGNQTGTEATKFGIRQAELGQALQIVRANAAGLELVGLHCHIGSQILDLSAYVAAANRMAELFAQVRKELDCPLGHLNIGGGFPLPYMTSGGDWQSGIFSPKIDYHDILAAVLPPLREKLGADVAVLVEPGRRVVGDAAILLTRVENEKARPNGTWLYTDAGYNTLVESYTYKWYYHCLNAGRPVEPLAPFRLAGPLCDNGDMFHDVEGEQTLARMLQSFPALAGERATLEKLLVRLPQERWLARSTAPGDLLAFLNTGAYTLDQMTPNNGRPRPEVGIIDAVGGYELLRRRDTYDDLLFNEVV
ncbi:MAG: diaminopimelate decarboxylase [Parvibaculaceae bacterium]